MKKNMFKILLFAALAIFSSNIQAAWTWAGSNILENDVTGWQLNVTSGTYAGTDGYAIVSTKKAGTGTIVNLRDEALPDEVKIVALLKLTSATELYLPDTIVYIGDDAFKNNTTIIKIEPFLPKGLKYIGGNAFYRAKNLAGDLSIAEESDSFSWKDGSSYIFQYCHGITSVKLGPAVTSIPPYLFDNSSGLTNVVMEGNITSIGAGAFNNCGELTHVTPFLPASVEFIGASAFYQNYKLQGPLSLGGNAVLPLNESRSFFRCNSVSNITFGSGVLEMPAATDYINFSVVTNIVFKGFPEKLGQSLYALSQYCTCITVPSENDQWSDYFSTNSLILWENLTDTQRGYFTSRFPNAENTPYGMCKIGSRGYYQWFFRSTVDTTGSKSLTVECFPAGIGGDCISPVLGTHENIAAEQLPLNCTSESSCISDGVRYIITGYTLMKWDGSNWDEIGNGTGTQYTFNPAENGLYKLIWNWGVSDYSLSVPMPTDDLGAVSIEGISNLEGYYEAGTTVSLSASAFSENAPFVRWFGDVPEAQISNAVINIVMDSPKTATPYFKQNWTFSSSAKTCTDGYWVIKTTDMGGGDAPRLSLQNGDQCSPRSAIGIDILDLRKPISGGGSFVQLGFKAFRYDSLVKELLLPDTIEIVGANAFEGSSVEKIAPFFPNSVTNIGSKVFYRPSGLTEKKMVLGGGGLPLTIPQTGTLFERAYSITEVVFGAGVEALSANMFSQCTGICDVYFYTKPEYASSTFAFSNYQTRLFVPKYNEEWNTFVNSRESVTPWEELSDTVKAKYTEKFGDSLLPAGLTAAAPANQWILFWRPPSEKKGTVILVK